jgi:hypothetical protein
MPDDGPVQHDVDMVAYDAEMLAAGFEFTDDEPEDDSGDTELTFLGNPETRPPD